MIQRIKAIVAKTVLLPLIAVVIGFSAASAQTVEEADAIEQTIRSQITAMQADDWDQAFAYASPMIQGIFKTPDNFSRMVTNGYPMVWRPRSYAAGSLTNTQNGLVQTMFFVDQQGREFVADYTMQLVDGVWRINGVQIRPASGQSA